MKQSDNNEESQAATSLKVSFVHQVDWVNGVAAMLLRSGGEVCRGLGEWHQTMVSRPGVLDREHYRNQRQIPRFYRELKKHFEHTANRIQPAAKHITPVSGKQAAFKKPGRQANSVLNGLLGDALRKWHHPFAVTMEMVDQYGHPVSLSEMHRNSLKGTVLFVHGLCCSEQEWASSATTDFLQYLEEQGYQYAWVRYNTGLPIWENGVQLASMLHQHLGGGFFRKRSLVLIGHSMGGLVIRSACHHARHYFNFPWIRSLTHAAYLASPHSGAPLARLSELTHSALKASPYSSPFRRFTIRSKGISSLQDGHILSPGIGDNHPIPVNKNVQHLLLGARLNHKNKSRWWGDGLVPENSALGIDHFPDHPTVQRKVLDDVSHTQLLKDKRTYQAIQCWMDESL